MQCDVAAIEKKVFYNIVNFKQTQMWFLSSWLLPGTGADLKGWHGVK